MTTGFLSILERTKHNGRTFPQVAGGRWQVADDGWRVAGSGWWVTGEGDGWRVTGDGWLVTGGKEILQLKNENKRSKVADTFFLE